MTTLKTRQEWGIFRPDGELDTDPEPMIFFDRRSAVELLNCTECYPKGSGYYVAKVSDELLKKIGE